MNFSSGIYLVVLCLTSLTVQQRKCSHLLGVVHLHQVAPLVYCDIPEKAAEIDKLGIINYILGMYKAIYQFTVYVSNVSKNLSCEYLASL